IHRLLGHIIFVDDDAIEQRTELRLDRRELQTDHRSAEHAWLVADLIHSAHETDRSGRIGCDKHDIRPARLNGTNYRCILDSAGGETAIVYDLQSSLFGILASPAQDVVSELAVFACERDAARFGIDVRRSVEESR